MAVQHDGFDHDDLPAFDFDYTVPALFAQDEFAASAWLTVVTSMRYDHHNEFGGQFSPRISLLTRTRGWVARASAGRGFFAPTPFTEAVEAVGLRRLQRFWTGFPE